MTQGEERGDERGGDTRTTASQVRPGMSVASGAVAVPRGLPCSRGPPGVPSTANASSAPSTSSCHACRCLPTVMQWLCAERSPAGAETANVQKPSWCRAAARARSPGAVMPARRRCRSGGGSDVGGVGDGSGINCRCKCLRKLLLSMLPRRRQWRWRSSPSSFEINTRGLVMLPVAGKRAHCSRIERSSIVGERATLAVLLEHYRLRLARMRPLFRMRPHSSTDSHPILENQNGLME